MLPENAHKFENKPEDPDLPGLGQHYCIACSRYFVDSHSLTEHRKTKPHKNRLKALKEEIYTGPAVKIDNGPKVLRPEEVE
jgi:bud site selection protein 20